MAVLPALAALAFAAAAQAQDQPPPPPPAAAPPAAASPPTAGPDATPPAPTPPDVVAPAPGVQPAPAGSAGQAVMQDQSGAPVATPTGPDQASAAPAVPPPPPAPSVQVQPLSPLDLFSAGRDAGLGPDLWKGSSAALARVVIPTLADHPLSPAAAALGRRVLGQAAAAPDGAGADADLAAARARALLALGDASEAGAILDRTPGVAGSAALSRTAAEAALINDQDDKACAIGDALAADRDGAYWLKLRAFCQASAGKPSAQLSASLADQQDKDPVFDRLIGVIIAGGGDPGPASLADGLDYAMSRQLKLDLAPALPDAAPAIAEHLAAGAPAPPPAPGAPPPAEADLVAALRKPATTAGYRAAARLALPAIVQLVQAKAPLQNPVQLAAAALAAGDVATAQAIRAGLTGDTVPGADATDLAILDAAIAAASGAADSPTLDRLVERGAGPDAKAAARAQLAAALVLALGWPADGPSRAAFIDFPIGHGDAPAARLLLLDAVADAGVRGDTALLTLLAAEPGAEAGPAPADRARLVRDLARAGFKADAAAFAVEGLLALESR
ncbi:MAG TPA: hypothetical protein VHZ26_05425 [Caulobacteraceae bacterium]|nr:hypothetical protein [Caulobacteraceae bacterium]